MDGISSSLAAASTTSAATQASNEVQTTVLGKALEQAQESVLPLLKGVGENVNTLA